MKELYQWLEEGPQSELSSYDNEMLGRARQLLLAKKNEARDNFFADEINTNRANDNLETLATNCTLKEILWILRNITYDQISYYDEDNKGKIYDGSYDQKHIEQANALQREISTMCDLFGQVIVGHRNFEEGYLEERVPSYMMSKMVSMKNEIERLERKLEDYE